MKTIKNIGLKLAVIMAVFMAVPAVGQAQVKKVMLMSTGNSTYR